MFPQPNERRRPEAIAPRGSRTARLGPEIGTLLTQTGNQLHIRGLIKIGKIGKDLTIPTIPKANPPNAMLVALVLVASLVKVVAISAKPKRSNWEGVVNGTSSCYTRTIICNCSFTIKSLPYFIGLTRHHWKTGTQRLNKAADDVDGERPSVGEDHARAEVTKATHYERIFMAASGKMFIDFEF